MYCTKISTFMPIFHQKSGLRRVQFASPTCPTQRPYARDSTQPIFHWKWGSHWLPNAKKSEKKEKKCTWLTQEICVTKCKIYQHVGILALGDAEVLSFALGDAKVPDARYFAFWWNIGLTVCCVLVPFCLPVLRCDYDQLHVLGHLAIRHVLGVGCFLTMDEHHDRELGRGVLLLLGVRPLVDLRGVHVQVQAILGSRH